LLARRYRGKLDQDADEFIAYMVSGVTRMHTLLNDMLAYSRVTESRDRPLVPANLNAVVQSALMNLDLTISENHAAVHVDTLPTLQGDEIQLTQVFQNLIGNAIKYKSDKPPEISITAEEGQDEWTICVSDNGIGVDPQYSERIFGIFKRLHGRELPGTGMGLAICKRIIERHNGRIWVEPGNGTGSRFCFTLPA
jgi:light-regulated signal transduction histidine kinase (bacteriophytochrome)